MRLLERLNLEVRAYDDPVFFVERILGAKLYYGQRLVLQEFYKKKEDGKRKYNELVCIAGMRSGKTTLGAFIALYEAFRLLQFRDPALHFGLPRGKEIFIINVATSEAQAKDTVFAEIRTRLMNSEFLMELNPEIYSDEIRFSTHNVVIRSEHSNSSSLVGRTTKVAIFDELSRFKTSQGKASAYWVYNSLSRSTKTFKDEGIVVTITSPVSVDDFAVQLLKRCGTIIQSDYCRREWPFYGGNIPTMLGVHFATWEFNDTFTEKDFKLDFEKNPEAARRDFGAIPSAAVETYFGDFSKFTDACVLEGPQQPKPDAVYVLAGDPALKNDAFAFALVHAENDVVIVDDLKVFRPSKTREIDPDEVFAYVASLKEKFPIKFYITDVWYFPETQKKIKQLGITVATNTVTKQVYDNLKEHFYRGKIKLFYNETLAEEMRNLQLIGGKKVEHPRGGSKDLADALANACFGLKKFGLLGYRTPKVLPLEHELKRTVTQP